MATLLGLGVWQGERRVCVCVCVKREVVMEDGWRGGISAMNGRGCPLQLVRAPFSPLKHKLKTHTHTLSRTQSRARGGARSWLLPRFAPRSGVSGWAGRHFQVLPLPLATRLKKNEGVDGEG